MSRIGKLPIQIPAGVTITIKDSVITAKGKIGELKQKFDPDIKLEVNDNQILVTRPTDQKRHRSLHGLTRSLVANMVKGVSEGFVVKQEVVGVGYRATNVGQVLELALGYSHNIFLELSPEIIVETVIEKRANPIITLKSADKQLLGQVAAKIRSFRKPEPYKGKGIKFVNEVLRRKAGKAAASA